MTGALWKHMAQVITTPSPGKTASVQHLGPVAMLSTSMPRIGFYPVQEIFILKSF